MFSLASLLTLLPFLLLKPINAATTSTYTGTMTTTRSAPSGTALPEMVYDCSNTPEVCTNMCFGAFCRGYDVELNWDKPTQKTKDDRRKKASCGSGNRCSKNSRPSPELNSCDEYPFASASNADDVQACNRCVPQAEQNSQGGTCSSFYSYKLNNQTGSFTVGFGNPDDNAVQYCEYDTQCNNDGNEYCGDDLCPDGVNSKHKRNYYVTRSGLKFISTRSHAPGARVVRVVKKNLDDLRNVAGLMVRDMDGGFDTVEDEVMNQIWKE